MTDTEALQPQGAPQQPPTATPAQSVPNTVQTAPTPPTGIDQQLASLNQQYEAVRNLPQVGYDERTRQVMQSQATGAALEGPTQQATTDLNSLARTLAESYGLPVGRGALVDAEGNFLVTPDQLAAASGGQETLGTAAAKMNYIADAIAARQQEQSQQKAVSALQTGVGLVQERGRGSLAAMQSGFYQNLASLYANEEYDAADFSYFIQKEQMDMQREILRRQEKLAKKQARFGMITGIIGGIAGIAMGNPAMALGGLGAAGGNAASTGWF